MDAGLEIAGRYRLLQNLGRGGFGEVWSATDLLQERPVALKFLHREIADSRPVVLAKFRQEARIAVRLDHPGITKVSDFGEYRGQWFLAMELLEGHSLAAEISGNPGGLPIPRVLSLTGQVVEALAAAHDLGVIHRDLKPANMMVIGSDRLKICDFGVAQMADSSTAGTLSGMPVGTPTYMAPEQWRGGPFDERTDLYALGVIMYVLLTGSPPFVSDTVYGLMGKHLNTAPVSPGAARPDLAPPLEELVLALLAKDPDDRPGDTSEVLARLAALPGQDVPAGTVRRRPRTLRVTTPPRPSGNDAPTRHDQPPASSDPPVGRHTRRTVLAGGAVGLAGLSGALFLGLFENDRRPTGRRAPRVDPGYARNIRPIRADAAVHTLADLFPPPPSRAIALTLDDGPDPTYTPMVLDILAEFQVHATFNVIGMQIAENPKLIQRISDAGHQLANHTITHPLNLSALPPRKINDEIIGCHDRIAQTTGTPPRYFRSPGGNWNPRIIDTAAAYGMICLDWSLDPRDWATPDTKKIAHILGGAKVWDILLCHDGGGNRARTAEALRIVIPALKADGFVFIAL